MYFYFRGYMRTCIYCREDKAENEFTLEHVLPQFIGGASAPDFLKTRDVCRSCNSNLGLFVDAGFEKDFLVHNYLKLAAHAFYDPRKPSGLPFMCMGISELQPPEMTDNEVCELWAGPLGERVYWIRTKDERLFWYSGGNPRTAKSKHSRAYFMFSENSQKDTTLTWFSFRDCFDGKKVRKVICGTVDGANPLDIGFYSPDELDKLRIKFFLDKAKSGYREKGRAAMYLHCDLRFLAKTAIGVAYCLLGSKSLTTQYSKELMKALWYRQGSELPKVNFGRSMEDNNDNLLTSMLSCDNAVTLTILPNPIGLGINFNISGTLNWVIQCALTEDISVEDKEKIGNGFVIILFKNLKRSIMLDYSDFLDYKLGNLQHDELNIIYNEMNKNNN